MKGRAIREVQSDLPVRFASAVVMITIAGLGLWAGGLLLALLVWALGLGLLWEYWGLVARITPNAGERLVWMAGGVVYIGGACFCLLLCPPELRWLAILVVIATDTGAYFAGRRFGGAKIAPAISPSKTWAGLYGGMVYAMLVMLAAVVKSKSALMAGPNPILQVFHDYPLTLAMMMLAGAALAVLAQTGDFFESWMKRRAGVKDSGALIPGHGGLFDRLDGLLPVAIAAGAFTWWTLM
ncbi:MAG: phosphatidate cytidylyltransferase [Sphingobium sp.]|nr:phosphatidate cytidylyltransferase [Sphingobium sp.]MBP8670151.1 phosphatidate cytidylyltransferase [Sphingobium sp.]MBP9157185.1 phosphatidate cytidylyltransferase [Sphingobium sp.]MCC6483046.1 phosphatidate cytidylyltransferase [Sphingomonadaceae bacterium]